MKVWLVSLIESTVAISVVICCSHLMCYFRAPVEEYCRPTKKRVLLETEHFSCRIGGIAAD